jgi:hypothetical protein
MAMAAALAPIVEEGEVASPTTVVATPSRAAPLPDAGRSPARSPSPAPRAVPRATRRRRAEWGPFAALPSVFRRRRSSVLVAGTVVVAVLGGGLLLGALPRDGAANDPTGRPSPTDVAAVPTARPDPTAEPTPKPTASPTPRPTEAPTALPAGDVADLCEIFFDIPCGLGAGRYAPSRFTPAFDIELGDGWSAATHNADTVALTREEGVLTLAGRVIEVYPDGQAREPRDRARDVIEAFIATPGVSATRPATVKIDGRRGLSTDLTPIDSARIQLFATNGTTFFLEPDRTTRVVVMNLKKATILVAIEPHEGYELGDILATADDAAATLRWR